MRHLNLNSEWGGSVFYDFLGWGVQIGIFDSLLRDFRAGAQNWSARVDQQCLPGQATNHAWGSPNWKVRKVNFNFSQNLVDCLCIVKSIILFYQECCAFFGWVGQCNGACFRFSLVRFPNPYACSSHAGHASGSPGRDIHLAQLNCGRFRSVSAVNIYISYIVYCAKQYCERFGSI